MNWGTLPSIFPVPNCFSSCSHHAMSLPARWWHPTWCSLSGLKSFMIRHLLLLCLTESPIGLLFWIWPAPVSGSGNIRFFFQVSLKIYTGTGSIFNEPGGSVLDERIQILKNNQKINLWEPVQPVYSLGWPGHDRECRVHNRSPAWQERSAHQWFYRALPFAPPRQTYHLSSWVLSCTYHSNNVIIYVSTPKIG